MDGNASHTNPFTDHRGWAIRRRSMACSSSLITYPTRNPGHENNLVSEPTTNAPLATSPRVQVPVANW